MAEGGTPSPLPRQVIELVPCDPNFNPNPNADTDTDTDPWQVIELVPGDVVFLRGGNVVPADAKWIEGDELNVDQAALTGESLPVDVPREDAEGEPGSGKKLWSGSIVKVIHNKRPRPQHETKRHHTRSHTCTRTRFFVKPRAGTPPAAAAAAAAAAAEHPGLG